jgi:class 3 adenylate cyclase/tetratricopeptide (TPR) repeat protein
MEPPPASSYALSVLACPSCGRENPDGFRFCGACGAELAAATGRETRKTVTVLFMDVSGSTALGERLDPESFRRVMARYFDLARACLERHGGTVEKFIGDAVMAVFGVPTVHEDDALRAVRAATELRDELGPLNEELERDYGVSLHLRTGVNTGEVVTGTAERLVTGDAVNVAARLEQAARPGEILLGEQTRQLARDAIEVDPVAPLELKGKAEPLAAHRLVRVLEGAPPFDRRLDAPLVGRREELACVRSAFDAAVSERRCRLVTVLGPPGIGKSRLAREVGAALSTEAEVLPGRCLPYGEGITYWPLREIFAAAGAEEELIAALGASAAEDVVWEVRKALERRARERPLALVFEDIHWAEPTLLDLIEHLADWTRDAPLLLLCLARPELLDEREGWGGRQGVGELLTLEPLSRAEAERLIEEFTANEQVEDDVRSRILEVAEGNPLFVEQLLAMLAEGGGVDQVPGTIQALLAARLDALPADERDVLERASVVGLEFEWEALAELAPDRRRPPGARLAALVRKDLIRPHDAIEDVFSFRHMLIRDAAYERVPKDLRSDLHERFARWLDGRGDEFEEIVGYNLEQAYRCLAELGPPTERGRLLAEQAAERLASAGRRAFARGDMPAAGNLLERSAALFLPEDPRRLVLLPALGDVLIDRGEWERAGAILFEASEAGRAAGQPGVAAYASVALSYVRLHMDPDSTHEQTRPVLEQAIRVFEGLDDRGGLARALSLAGSMRLWAGQAAAAVDEFERAAAHAREAGDRAQEMESLRYSVIALLHGPMPVLAALERVADIRRRGQGHGRVEVSTVQACAHLEAMSGSPAAARKLIAEAESTARELGLETLLAAGVLRSAGEIELLAGDPRAAERAVRPACESLERMGDWGHYTSAVPGLADALYAQGRGHEAAREVELAVRHAIDDDVDAQIGLHRVRARLLALKGDFEEAERFAREAIRRSERTDYLVLHAEAFVALAEVLRLAGRLPDAAAALEEAIQLHEQKGNVVGASIARALLAELTSAV